MKPQIDFRHVLSELSVNRNDPCEVIRELISNAYDAYATKIRYAAVPSYSGFVFWDNGFGLSRKGINGKVAPYEAFFSIGKSTKEKGEGIGYKCQGAKLCFACSRILVISRTREDSSWFYKLIENPRDNLDLSTDISPTETSNPLKELRDFYSDGHKETNRLISQFDERFFDENFSQGTLICVQRFDTDNFNHFIVSEDFERSYLYNFIRFYTKHGDTRAINPRQGFSHAQVKQINTKLREITFELYNGKKFCQVPFGFPYLEWADEADIKGPEEIVRLRDGRFSCRYAKKIKYRDKNFCFMLAVDGNRRAHDGYFVLDRKGKAISGIRLTDQRGMCLSVSGIKICQSKEIFLRPELNNDYGVLSESDALSHFVFIVDGEFDLVTNRNALTRSSSALLEDSSFLQEIRQFLDAAKRSAPVFDKLLSRLKKERRDVELNQQLKALEEAKRRVASRERFRLSNRIFLSPIAGEEYWVGVLYAALGLMVDSKCKYLDYWKHVLTFSTRGIDSLGARTENNLRFDNLLSIEYKYIFSNSGPFNHALNTIDFIVAWNVNLNDNEEVYDDYECFGKIKKKTPFLFEISDIESRSGEQYQGHMISVLDLQELIRITFNTTFRTPEE